MPRSSRTRSSRSRSSTCRPARGPVTDAGFSVVAFETWLKDGDQTILDGIAAYNRDDCVSTWLLRGWLEERRAEAVGRWPELGWERPVALPQAPSPALTDWLRAVEERVAGLTADLAPDDHSPDAEARRLLADLLDWHRREEKSQWWRWFELKDDLTIEQLVNERDALAGLVFVDEFEGEGVMRHRRYRFQPQDHNFDPGDEAFATETGKATGTIVSIDDAAGIDRAQALAERGLAAPERRSWASAPLASAGPEAGAASCRGRGHRGRHRRRWGLPGGPRHAPPPAASPVGGLGRPPSSNRARMSSMRARRLALELESGTLPIQGPPGTGKTYAGARMILDLVRAGKRSP